MPKCIGCGKEFPYDPRHSKKRFCSRECGWEAKRKQPKTYRTCEVCNKPFMVRRHPNQRFCSKACFGVWQSQNSNFNERVAVNTKSKGQVSYGLDVVLKLPNYNKVDSLEGIPCFCCSELLRCDATKCEKMLEWLTKNDISQDAIGVNDYD